METKELKGVLEALIFAAEEPIGMAALCGILEEVTKSEIQTALSELTAEYNENGSRGLLLREVGGAWQFVTKPSAAAWIEKLHVDKPKTLSQAALETISIIAYRQPVVRAEVEQIRGVDSGGVLKTLLERGLIKIVGRREEPGQPLIYGTTPAFLELFHLTSLEELPSMKEIEQIVEESQRPKEEAPAGEEPAQEQPEEASADGEDLTSAGTADDETLMELEGSIKKLSKLEREIFPKEKSEESPAEAPSEETKLEN